MNDFNNIMLNERQVYEVIRIEDNTFIAVHYTRKEAYQAMVEYVEDFAEPCRIGVSYIMGEETVGQRNENSEE